MAISSGTDGRRQVDGQRTFQRVRLFCNPVAERLTLVSLPLFLAVWSCAIGVIAAVTLHDADVVTPIVSRAEIGAAILTGMMFWPVFEYLMHRFLFHYRPSTGLGRHLIFLIHGNHHASPSDPLRSLVPPHVGLCLASVIWAASHLLLGAIGDAAALGFILFYVGYDLVHWACHQKPTSRGVLGKLRRHHLRHHHQHDKLGRHINFAITVPLLDRLFGTQLKSR